MIQHSKLTKKFNFIFLSLIFILSLLTRFYKLTDLPKAVATDEIALVYNGWSLATTGRDEWGEFLPLSLRSFDDWKPAVYSYLTIPGIILFGANIFSARLPAAFFGSILPVILYFVVFKLTKKQDLSLITALVVAISPWHIEISRTAIEAGVALTLSMLALLALLQKSKRWQWMGLGLIVISLFTYHTARLIAPLIILLAIVFGQTKLNRFKISLALTIFILGISLALTGSSGRFKQISIFTDQNYKLLREEAIREDGNPLVPTKILETRIFHNKPWSWILAFTESYLSNTSLHFLFMGGAQPPRVTIPETGQFLLIFLPFFIIGLGASCHSWKKLDQFLLLWLLVAPIPASLPTAELPHTYRTLYMLPPIAFFIAQGITTSFHFVKSKVKSQKSRIMNYGLWILTFGFFLLVFANFAKSWHQYRVHQQVHQPWYRQYGYRDLVTYLNTLKDATQFIITNRENEPYIYFLLYNQVIPQLYQSQAQKRLSHQDIEAGIREWQLFNYIFSELACPYDTTDTDPTHYYIVHFNCVLPENFKRIKTINFMDSEPEFHVDQPSKQALSQ